MLAGLGVRRRRRRWEPAGDDRWGGVDAALHPDGALDGGVEDTDASAPPAATICDVRAALFDSLCTSCHNGSVQPLDLRGGAVAERLVDQWGVIYDAPLVVPGAPHESLLYQKAAGTQPMGFGDSMPPGSTAPADALVVLEGWITVGASADCDVEPPPGEIAPLAPVDRAVRASMAIRGVRPSPAELDAIVEVPDALHRPARARQPARPRKGVSAPRRGGAAAALRADRR